MATRVTRRILPILMDRLELFYPKSLQIHGALSAIYQCKSDNSEIWVDRWPEVNAVLISPTDEHPRVPVLDHEHKLFATDTESAETLLKTRCPFDGQQRVDFIATREKLWPLLIEMSSSQGFDINIADETAWMFYLPRSGQLVESPKLSSEFDIGRLLPCHASMVNSVWPTQLGFKTEVYIKGLIKRFPTVAIFEQISGNLVAWNISYEDGAMGHLYVHPAYRRQGLGTITVLHQANEILAMGRIPYMAILESNAPSIDMHNRLGFVQMKDERYSWIICTKAG